MSSVQASPLAIPPTPGPAPARPVAEHHFTTHDGVSLFYRHWPARDPATRQGGIVLFHRGHEHSGRLTDLVEGLDLPDFDLFAWDARGHGRSPGARGDSPSFGTSVRDIQTFVQHIEAHHGIEEEDLGVIAQSVGAVLASAWVHDYAPRIRALVLASPAFKVKLYVPFARPGLRLLRALRGNFFVNSYVKSRFLTHDPARQASFDADTLITRAISVNILLGLYEAAERVVSDAAAIVTPTQLLISGADWVVHAHPQEAFFAALGSPIKEKHVLPGFYHDTFGEADRHIPIGHARRFLLERFAAPLQLPDLSQAHRSGYTRSEADRLARPYPALSPRGLYWSLTRANLALGGHLSAGVALGHRTGFDSGSTLDYVYRNEARGIGLFAPLGQLADRHYLNAIGWRGIRQRKVHIESLLQTAMDKLQEKGQPVHLVDIAAGHGRYVLEAVAARRQPPDSIRLRDFSPENVAAGQALIAAKGLTDLARFEQGDAFDRESLARLASPAPTLAIVSGLYELFPDNDPVATSLAGLAAAVPPGGYLIYTGQPWHPQLEFIARALTSHRGGQAWVMRRRTQAEMDQLVAAAGFDKLTQLTDEWGIFTVSLARRRG